MKQESCDFSRERFNFESVDGIYPIEIKKGVNPVNYKKNFQVLEKYNRKIFTGLVIDSCESIMPVNENVYYCPISLIGK